MSISFVFFTLTVGYGFGISVGPDAMAHAVGVAQSNAKRQAKKAKALRSGRGEERYFTLYSRDTILTLIKLFFKNNL